MYKLVAVIIIVFSAKFAIAQDGITKSNWVNVPVKIDGTASEWKQPLRFYDTNTKLSFSFLNDSTNLYLCFEAPDPSNQMKIIRAGMKVSLSIKGKDKHKVSITYPVAQKMPVVLPEENSENHEQKFARANMRNSFFVQNTMMEVKGFVDREGDISIKDSSGINAAINWDSTGNLFYEIAIPLKEIFGADYSTDLLKEISMEATVNAVERHNSSGESGGGRGGGGGGFRDGGGGGRMGGGGGRMGGSGGRQRSTDDSNIPGTTSANRMAMFTKSSLKQKFVLALAK